MIAVVPRRKPRRGGFHNELTRYWGEEKDGDPDNLQKKVSRFDNIVQSGSPKGVLAKRSGSEIGGVVSVGGRNQERRTIYKTRPKGGREDGGSPGIRA